MLLNVSLLYLFFSAMAVKNHNVFRAPPFKTSVQTKLSVPNLYFQKKRLVHPGSSLPLVQSVMGVGWVTLLKHDSLGPILWFG